MLKQGRFNPSIRFRTYAEYNRPVQRLSSAPPEGGSNPSSRPLEDVYYGEGEKEKYLNAMLLLEEELAERME